MRIDMNTPVDILMHGGDICYIDLDEGELCHWKYIKREKLGNGKYRYYYDQSELDKLQSDAKKAERQYVTDATKAGFAKIERDDAEDKYRGMGSVRTNKQDKILTNARIAYQEAHEKAKVSEKKAQAAEKKYQTKKITSFPARAISKGVVKIANLLSGSSKKKKKKK